MSTTYKARILLVDDEESFVEALSQRLENRNLQVTAVNSGKDAVDMIDCKEFDAVILDLAMPGMDGIETLKKIKADHPDTEIIMLTGHGTLEKGIEAIKLGAGDFLEKPVDIKTLVQKINEAHDKRVTILEEKSQEQIDTILKRRGW